MATLFWTADSPYCRIAIWSAASLGFLSNLELKHMNWAELNLTASGGILGNAATVPCLRTDASYTVSDSLRLIAHFMEESFHPWLLSTDGEIYRIAEGQLSRVMYALYDGAQGKTLEKVRLQWLRALVSLETTFLTLEPSAKKSLLEEHDSTALLSIAPVHVLLGFCLSLKPEWRNDLPRQLESLLKDAEKSLPFWTMRDIVHEHNHGVPCTLPV